MRLATYFTRVGATCVLATSLVGPVVSYAAGNAAAGQHDFSLCARCHSSAPGVNMRGPSLAGVVGRKSGVVVGYSYSAAMAAANLTWDDAKLDKFLTGPRSFVPGTRMSVSVASGAERQDIIAYLNTLK
jgi:cytochrome c2